MTFQLASLTEAQINKLSPKVKEEVLFVKDNTERFDKDFFEIFGDNDKRLFNLASAELAASDKTEKPKASKPKVEPKPAVKAEKPEADSTPPKPAEPVQKVIKSIEQKAKAAKKEEPKPKAISEPKEEILDFSWRRKVDEVLMTEAQKVEIHCEFYAITAEKDMKVEIKQTFNKGDTLLVHADGYPFAVMKPEAFKNRCAKVVKKYDLPEKKKTKTEEPVPFRTWLDGQIELWKNRETNRKISKVMAVKSNGDIIVEFTHYDKLLRVADLRLTYHKICLQSTKLTKVAPPARGTYRILVSKKDLQKDYSTNRNWNDCKSWIREAYGCAREGNCSESQKELFKKYYHQCGDKIAKTEDIEYLRWLHKKTGEQWIREKESYFEAFRRVREEMKKKKNQ